jgi:hypothetical protein
MKWRRLMPTSSDLPRGGNGFRIHFPAEIGSDYLLHFMHDWICVMLVSPVKSVLRAVSSSRLTSMVSVARSGGQGWPQAIATGGAERPWRPGVRRKVVWPEPFTTSCRVMVLSAVCQPQHGIGEADTPPSRTRSAELAPQRGTRGCRTSSRRGRVSALVGRTWVDSSTLRW